MRTLVTASLLRSVRSSFVAFAVLETAKGKKASVLSSILAAPELKYYYGIVRR